MAGCFWFCEAFAEVADFILQLGVFTAELIYGVFQLAVLFTESHYLTIDICQVLDEAFILHGEDAYGVLHTLESVIAVLALVGKVGRLLKANRSTSLVERFLRCVWDSNP